MAILVQRHIEGHYEASISKPNSDWIEALMSQMQCNDATIVSLALGVGLVELCKKFGTKVIADESTPDI